MVRPSYVLGGRAMEVVHADADLERYMREAVKVSNDSPVLLDRFLDHAVEVDIDVIADRDGNVLVGGGDAAHRGGRRAFGRFVLLAAAVFAAANARRSACASRWSALAKALDVVGLMNTQFAVQVDERGEDASSCWK